MTWYGGRKATHERTRHCLFCDVAAGKQRAWVVLQDDETVAFLDAAPATRGHTLIVPRRHASDLWEITEHDACAVMVMVHRVAALLRERLSPDGLTLFQANRRAGWQDVFHLHVHVVPRYTGDGLVRPWSGPKARPEELDRVTELLSRGN